MKKLLPFLFIFFSHSAISQTPGVKYIKAVKSGTEGEAIYDIKRTPDNGFIAVGTDSVFNFFRPSAHEKSHAEIPFIWKLDSAGNITWQRSIYWINSAFTSVALSHDGGYVAAGHAGDYNVPWDTSKFFIAKFNAAGQPVWEKHYGGSQQDHAFSIAPTSSGGYIVVGQTKSIDGDVTGNHGPAGTSDVWMVKINADGNIIWKKCFGGTANDIGFSVVELSDRGYAVAGYSTSSNGDLTANNGMYDGWVFRTDSAGVLQWQKNYGGINNDILYNLAATADGNFIATGYTSSTSAVSNGIKGLNDVWVLKIANGGTAVWSKGFGGSQQDYGVTVTTTQNNNYIVSGTTESNNFDVIGHNGLADAWMFKVSEAGNLVWQKPVGSGRDEFGFAGIYLSESEFVLAGSQQPASPPGDVLDGFVAYLGNSSLLWVNFVGPFAISEGMVTATKPGGQFTAIPSGSFAHLDIDTGQYVVNFSFPNSYYTVTPATVNVPVPNYFDTVVIQFNVTPIPNQQDLTISGLPLTPSRPGFSTIYKLFYKNVGTVTTSGQVVFKKDSRLNFTSATPAPNTITGDTLKWNYTNLQPFDTASITVNMIVSVPPIVNINDTLTSMGIITPVTGDLTPSDDTVIIRQRVIGSYDPNDKTENLSGRISPQQVVSGSFINYIIRFQNTGTDTAFNIVVRDTLDAKLDWNSFRMVAASHPYELSIASQNRLAWQFNNIQLVDSNRNEPRSHGFIAYKIKPKNNLLLGDIIRNSASIYFDYNLPVRTNIQQTIVMADVITGVTNPRVDISSMSVYPNPGGETLWLSIKQRMTGEASVSVFDLSGREVSRKALGQINTDNYLTSINISSLPAGMYTILLNAGSKIFSQKLIIQ